MKKLLLLLICSFCFADFVTDTSIVIDSGYNTLPSNVRIRGVKIEEAGEYITIKVPRKRVISVEVIKYPTEKA